MGTVDLDAIGAARRETQRDAPKVKFKGKVFDLPVEMPFAVVEAVGRLTTSTGDETAQAIGDIAKALFGKKFKDFIALDPSMDDMTALMEGIAPAYGTSPGESQASE